MHIAAFDMSGPAHYINIGWFSVSVGNLIVEVLGIGLFLGALLLPFPGNKEK